MSLSDDVREAGFREIEAFLAGNAFRMRPDPALSAHWGREFTCHRGTAPNGAVVEVVAGRDEATTPTRVAIFEPIPGVKGAPTRYDLATVAEFELSRGALRGSLGRPCLADAPRVRNEGLLRLVRRMREESIAAADAFFEHGGIPYIGPRP